ncbi:hypothetical protein [Curtobacterium sp. MCBD17_032]|uniref:hypothetical protein n=1 Tax=Curtobacterium sp. MCBD17_032 TaxID=2175659 RepID=UPI000DAA720F|nr:hypothetical protein [Curtobacterium sp. MCBD17_032]PZE84154.1 hypothetical protein DEI91_09675 [Curtobacterium sp. MCBD17_032]
MPTFGARLTIDGQALPDRWDGSAATALNKLEIVWGRSDPYDEGEPGTLSARIIDPTGDWFASGDLSGADITVTRLSAVIGNRIVFRGRISKATATRQNVYNPVSRTREPVWIVTVSAGDRLADAAATVLRGEMGAKSVEGPGGWGEQGPVTRLDNLFDRGAAKLFSAHDTVDLEAVPDRYVVRRLHGQSASDQRSVLELLAQVYQLVPLGVVTYDPHANAVRVGSYATAGRSRLTYANGVIGVSVAGARVIDAGKVAVPDGLQGESTASDAIDTVQVSYYWYGADPNLTPGQQKRVIYTGAFLQRDTARGRRSDTNRILKIDTEAMYLDADEFDPGAVDGYNRFPGWLADRIVEIVNTLNGQVRLPTLRLDDRRLPLPTAVSDAYYRPYQLDEPVYFAGSAFNVLPNAGPQYQAIGGTLRYDRGWTHDLTVTPARSNARGNLTIAGLFGASDAPLGNFDPTIRIGDLATVNQGL